MALWRTDLAIEAIMHSYVELRDLVLVVTLGTISEQLARTRNVRTRKVVLELATGGQHESEERRARLERVRKVLRVVLDTDVVRMT